MTILVMPDGIDSPHRGFSNQTPVGFVQEHNPSPVHASLNPAPGSADLIQDRTVGGYSGTNNFLKIWGAVTGRNNEWTGLKTDANARNIGQKGVVVGGSDYLNQLSEAYQASQTQMITDQASANALFSVV
jgi:hypothetical protein